MMMDHWGGVDGAGNPFLGLVIIDEDVVEDKKSTELFGPV
jgi:hypothetical protein